LSPQVSQLQVEYLDRSLVDPLSHVKERDLQCVLELFSPLHPGLPQIVDLLQVLFAQLMSQLVLLLDCFLEVEVLFF
jgi:hypothetical protein